ncbi:hypothetical protein GCM10011385_31440 [Nitratireductor aestuarii]|uniref:Ketoreductase domain-containing protein n=1 Tax=Nitratireductor aestuarii TaxID=1735103 RepID=A0A916W7T4_9HYPH|nr:SDR family oxidoreductase [Nitratireductor aestuarii]GGA75130.1 hypothetical protein GCM10011385_31440 [Nitratireductor aestuarii]
MQTVLLTGAASGIGREAALHFAASGWRVLAVDRDREGLDRLLGELQGSNHLALQLDLTSAEEIASLGELDCTIDAVVNNAGMSDTSGTPLVEKTEAELQRLYALNTQAPALIFRALREKLVPGARIVNVSSGAGIKAIPLRGAYSPSKAAVIAQSQALAKTCPEFTVTCLCPGFVRTDLVESLIAAGRLDPAQAVSKIPLGRMASTAEMARAVTFLAGEGARPFTGQTFVYDGGSSIYGGSARVAPTERQLVSHDVATRYTLVDGPEDFLSDVPAGTYPAVIDFSPLKAAEGKLAQAVHTAAVRFAAEHQADAALTLVLPPRSSVTEWEQAGDEAAAEMLVRTLACELASSARRVNAVRLNGPASAAGEFISFIAGVEAQFLTGQILELGAGA